MSLSRIRRSGIGVLAALLVALLAGCAGNGIQSVPLPGGVATGDDPRTYEIQFEDVLDLVPQSMVKMNGIPVGRIDAVTVPGDQWYAQVRVTVQNHVDLSDASRAEVQQTSLLGEKFIALIEPEDSAELPRQDPAEPIPLSRTDTGTDVEQILGALSLLLNNGGIDQIEPIITELNTVFAGRSDRVKGLLEESQDLISGLNRQRDEIVTAIDGLAALSDRALGQTEQIERILAQMPAGIEVLEEQRPQLLDLLGKVDELGEVGTDILGTAHDEIITDLKALRPVLTELAAAADDIVTASPMLLTHPFPDSLLPAVQGDATNLFMTLDLRILNQLEALGVGQGEPVYSPPSVHAPRVDPRNPYVGGNGPRYGWPTITLLPPGPNWRLGPNTPPSGGTYPMNPGYGDGDTARSPATRTPATSTPAPSAPAGGTQYSVTPGGNFLDEPLSMIGVGP